MNRERGFTTIELLTAMTVLGLVTGALVMLLTQVLTVAPDTGAHIRVVAADERALRRVAGDITRADHLRVPDDATRTLVTVLAPGTTANASSMLPCAAGAHAAVFQGAEGGATFQYDLELSATADEVVAVQLVRSGAGTREIVRDGYCVPGETAATVRAAAPDGHQVDVTVTLALHDRPAAGAPVTSAAFGATARVHD